MVSFVVLEFLTIINDIFKKFIFYSIRIEMHNVMKDFKLWCGLVNVHNVINETNISIFKLVTFYLEDYY